MRRDDVSCMFGERRVDGERCHLDWRTERAGDYKVRR